MDVSLEDFCEKLSSVENIKALSQKALAILFWHDEKGDNRYLSSGDIAKIIKVQRLGSPNSTILGKQIKETRKVISNKKGFRLKRQAKNEIKELLQDIITGVMPKIDHSKAFLPDVYWLDAKSYIKKICVQLNGCYQHAYYDAASVLVRRLIETLIIEVYEFKKRETEIKGLDGHYLMLGDLINISIGDRGLLSGREIKRILKKFKEQGDRSAHNRYYVAKEPDLGNIKDSFRVAFQELMHMADM